MLTLFNRSEEKKLKSEDEKVDDEEDFSSGLFICKKIVDMNSGSITVFSKGDN